MHGRGTQRGCFPALQAGYVNFAYMKAGPLAKRPPRGLRPLIVVLGFTQTLNSAPTQVLRYLAQNRTVRAKARFYPSRDRLSDQFYWLLDRIPDHFARHWPRPWWLP